MIGARLGKWLIDKKLGSGGMGDVFLAHELSNDPAETAHGERLAAVKVLAPELARDSGFLSRFRREIEILQQLDHPGIVRFFESGEQDKHVYYAMEYVDGETFEQLILNGGRVPWEEALDLAIQVCPALKHAHDRGIIHRDIKPSNLLRTRDGEVKLTDFGIAKAFATNALTATGSVVGTAEYLAPELAEGKPASKRSDLYSFGVVLYALLTGRPPFRAESVAEMLHKHRYGQF
ncbi:MAG TPA: serine/threonine-protein kinase, partial [Gemmataceae bacterium]|nr:serine/threonine-protein kinase [Gemmataceae bacterium]